MRDQGSQGSGEHSGHRCGGKCSQGDEEHSVSESNGEHFWSGGEHLQDIGTVGRHSKYTREVGSTQNSGARRCTLGD